MNRQQRLEAIADYFRWTDAAVLGHLLTREASLEAYADYLELEELREFKAVAEELHEFKAMVEEGIKEARASADD